MVQESTPRQRIGSASRRHGEAELVAMCVAVLEGRSAEPMVLAAGSADHWRIREMVATVIRRRQIFSPRAEALLEQLAADPTPRVRAAAERAMR